MRRHPFLSTRFFALLLAVMGLSLYAVHLDQGVPRSVSIETEQAEKAAQTEGSSASTAAASSIDGYYYSQLSDEEKGAYGRMLSACEDLESSVVLTPISMDSFQRAETALRADHPEYFWLMKDGMSYQSDALSGHVVKLNFAMDGNEQQEKDAIAAIANEVVQSIPEGADDYTKALALYDWVVDHTDYGDGGRNNGQDIRSVFLDGESVCAGYAQSYAYLAHLAGLQCAYVTGTAENNGSQGRHAWDLVSIDGSWCWVDPTWGDPVFEGVENVPFDKDYDFFCVSDAVLFPSHTLNASLGDEVQQAFSYPYCSDESLDWYVRQNAFFESYDQAAVSACLENEMQMGMEKDLAMRFGSSEAMHEAYNDLIASQNIRLVPSLSERSFRAASSLSDESRVLHISILEG